MKLYVGIDLHANNHYLGIIDEENKVLSKHKVANLKGGVKVRQVAEVNCDTWFIDI